MNTPAPSSLDQTLNKFVSVTAKSKVAIVVPLYGYWNDATSDQLNAETLRFSLSRIYSSVHQLYLLFVGDPSRTSKDIGDIILSKNAGGNTRGIATKNDDTYADYIRKGIKAALEETDAQFVVVANPWMMIQHNGIDILIDRVNRDDAKIVSGFDVRGVIDPALFHTYAYNTPTEKRDLNFDFMGMKRYAAEMVTVDPIYKTHYFLARDMWQTMYTQGFETITTQKLPIFSFEVDWTDLEAPGDFSADKEHFLLKWKYDPSITYGK